MSQLNDLFEKIDDTDLKIMAQELVELKNTGVMCDGKIRDLMSEVEKIISPDSNILLHKGAESFRVTVSLVNDEIVKRFAK